VRSLGPGPVPLYAASWWRKGPVLEGELAMATEEDGEEPKQVEQEGDHRAGIVSGSGPIDRRLASRLRFWRRTGRRVGRYGVNPLIRSRLRHEVRWAALFGRRQENEPWQSPELVTLTEPAGVLAKDGR
jgi:hypothetical protein